MGLFYGGGFADLEQQSIGAFGVLLYSGVFTRILALILKFTIGFWLGADKEVVSIHEVEYAEPGYGFAIVSGSF
ncbi:hypothetical protein [Mycobacterium leprae]|uniref:hypothetical protein n=1 Tax=Mycobacterium leprae TaxID=1769 RepID=UPI000011E224